MASSSSSQWQSGAAAYADSEMSHTSYPSDRNPGPLGDLYTSVDRTRDARMRYGWPFVGIMIAL